MSPPPPENDDISVAEYEAPVENSSPTAGSQINANSHNSASTSGPGEDLAGQLPNNLEAVDSSPSDDDRDDRDEMPSQSMDRDEDHLSNTAAEGEDSSQASMASSGAGGSHVSHEEKIGNHD